MEMGLYETGTQEPTWIKMSSNKKRFFKRVKENGVFFNPKWKEETKLLRCNYFFTLIVSLGNSEIQYKN